MTLHICRDFISQNSYNPLTSMYFTAIFMRVVLGYSVIGHTNFAVDGATFRSGTGTSGAISAAAGFTNRFTPDGYVVSSADINRILVIRSNSFPLLNSGLWRVTGVDTAANQFIFGLRGEPPVPESGLTWALYVQESGLPNSNGTNGNTNQYRGRLAASSTSRTILQSPHGSAYQVRLTYETATDYSSTLPTRNKFTVAPGYGGDSIGDFPVGGTHLHGALWKNQSVNNSGTGTVIGCCSRDVTAVTRYYIWGEDSTGTVAMCTRPVTDSSTANICVFGLPEDEEYPNDLVPARRLFAYGNIAFGGSGAIRLSSGPAQSAGPFMAVALGYSGQPIACSTSLYGYLSGQQFYSDGPYYDADGTDNPFLAVTELLTCDLFAGTWDYGDFNGQDPDLFLEPRRLGRLPIVRIGRSNYGDFTTSTDGQRTWIHMQNGVYLPWYGSILP